MEQNPFGYRRPEYVPNDPQRMQGDEYDEGMDFGMLGDIASGAGNLIDLPGSMVRDTISFSNPFDQLMSPVSSDNRTSGADISRYWAGGDVDSGGNQLAGMLIDILTDPLMLASGGTLAAGKMGAQAAGSVAKGVGKAAAATKSGLRSGLNKTHIGKVLQKNKNLKHQANKLETPVLREEAMKRVMTPEQIAADGLAYAQANRGQMLKDSVAPYGEALGRGAQQVKRSLLGNPGNAATSQRIGYDVSSGAPMQAARYLGQTAKDFGQGVMAGNRNAMMQAGAIGTNAASTMGGLHRSQEPSIEEMIAQAIMEDPELGSQLLEILGVGQPQY